MGDKPHALFMFDLTCEMARPWANAGVVCYCLDIQHPQGETRDPKNPFIIKIGADARWWRAPQRKWLFAAFFPPCTDVAVSGARWFKSKGLRRLSQAIELFAVSQEVAESLDCPYIIENPVSTISSYWRSPDYTFDPCDYGDPYTKKTCLWTGGGFVMPEKRRVEPTEGSRMHLLPPSPDRANLRSATPAGFAKAVFESNYREEYAA